MRIARPVFSIFRKQAKDLARDRGIALSAAQLALAREYGFTRWERLVDHVRRVRNEAALTTPLIRPAELRPGRPYTLEDSTVVTTDLSRGADVDRAGMPWATPLAWALRGGHDVVAARLTR